jgi:hypothetical protein
VQTYCAVHNWLVAQTEILNQISNNPTEVSEQMDFDAFVNWWLSSSEMATKVRVLAVSPPI